MQYLRLTRLRLQMDSGFKYDLFVVGGGSGGLATSKAAAKLG
jgi:glycerol-3-phosphate dehydrogenase